MLFVSSQKRYLFLSYSSFGLDFLVINQKGLIKRIKVNLKFYDVAACLTNYCNTHIAQYFEMSGFVSHACCNNFSFRAFAAIIYWASSEVLLNPVAPLDSALISLYFDQISVFWTSGFDCVSIVLDPELYFSHSI